MNFLRNRLFMRVFLLVFAANIPAWARLPSESLQAKASQLVSEFLKSKEAAKMTPEERYQTAIDICRDTPPEVAQAKERYENLKRALENDPEDESARWQISDARISYQDAKSGDRFDEEPLKWDGVFLSQLLEYEKKRIESQRQEAKLKLGAAEKALKKLSVDLEGEGLAPAIQDAEDQVRAAKAAIGALGLAEASITAFEVYNKNIGGTQIVARHYFHRTRIAQIALNDLNAAAGKKDASTNKSAAQKEADKLSDEALSVIAREVLDRNTRSAQDRDAIVDSLYAGEEITDRHGVRVRMSSVVLRPQASAVNRVYFTDRKAGESKGLSIVSHYLNYNKALPDNWGPVLSRGLNHADNLSLGSPEYYRVLDQVSLRSPAAACKLCISQELQAPVNQAGTWGQGWTERYAVQGQDKGFQVFNASGVTLPGSDTITITVSQNQDRWTATYYNVTLGTEIFTASAYFVANDGTYLGKNTLASAPASLRGFVSTPDNLNVELEISAPGFGASKIDVLLKGSQFLSVF